MDRDTRMTLPTPLLIRGLPGSPYTRKLLALLRYRGIAYRLRLGGSSNTSDLPLPRVPLIPTVYLPNAEGELEALVDSTPLIRRFEQEFSGRSVIPPDPVVAFFDYLLEDYADEWLTKAMFHYRWSYQSDIQKCEEILVRWTGISEPEEHLQQQGQAFGKRQVDRLYVVGSNATTGPLIEASYQRFLTIFKNVLEQQPYLMGHRPGASDFGVYGQLTQLAQFDPTPMSLTLREAPRVYAWVDIVDDLSGYEVDDKNWLSRDALKARLGDLLGEIGRTYVPVMLANVEALMRGTEQVSATVDGQSWIQQPFPYQGKCVQRIRQQYEDFSSVDREFVDSVLAGSGCEDLVKP
ncbi:MAG: glutathione S-transferase [Porticoccaceae bacterium]|nr:glutathione S-transferase [Porticoccaceae bacterium]